MSSPPSPSPHEKFLTELRAVRLARKLTHGQLATRIKISRSQYTAIENGRSLIGFTHLHNLAIALGVRWTIGELTSPAATRYVSE